ncbi:uncharacterized protein LOC134684783 [Mytilus trossulus]|uniref:uncharacterized protein LOC134684783 n=1 Tax=Mytilus trossulus TaxID=6551 RepID=UPI003005EFBC
MEMRELEGGYPLGLFKCNENKTQELIRLLKQLTEKYVPLRNGEIFEPVFLGGDRLTDERVQSAQTAISNADSPKEKLKGFISKIEDFHRLMNFLEAIYKLTYNTESASDKCTMHYYRNLLNNMRNVKGKVKNASRPFKLLYYTILDAICLLLFLDHLKMTETEKVLPENFQHKTKDEKIAWINDICSILIQQWFFEDTTDICQNLREVVFDRDHPVNYWLANLENGRIKCHFCPKSYAYLGSLKSHESKVHNLPAERKSKTVKPKDKDRVQDYIALLFKLVLLHKNLDSAVDMGNGGRSVRSAKYELPVYNKTNKTKYSIGSIHLTALTSGLLPSDQEESLINNRFINLQGGKNNNFALDEFVEMLNRDSKVACSGHQTVESIIAHSKEYPIVIDITKHFDAITEIHQRKGCHHLPSYKEDVLKVMKELQELNVLENKPGRTFKCKALVVDRNP